jgi:hypothetical protein
MSVSSSNTVTRTSAGWEWECEKPQTLPLPCPLTTEWQDAMRSRKSRRTSLGCGRLAVDLQPTFVRFAAHGAPSRPAKNPRYDSLFANRAGVPALVRAPHKLRRMALRIDGLPIAKRPARRGTIGQGLKPRMDYMVRGSLRSKHLTRIAATQNCKFSEKTRCWITRFSRGNPIEAVSAAACRFSGASRYGAWAGFLEARLLRL